MTLSSGPSRAQLLRSVAALTATAPLVACANAGSRSSYDLAAARARRPLERPTERGDMHRQLVRYATLAPSSHNTQGWKFVLEANDISILPDLTRRCPAVDPDDHHLFVSLGAAAENLVQAAFAVGLHSDVRFDPMGDGAVRLDFQPMRARTSPLFLTIAHRQCMRAAYDRRTLRSGDLRALESAGTRRGVRVLVQTGRRNLERILAYVVRANAAQMNDPAFITELRA